MLEELAEREIEVGFYNINIHRQDSRRIGDRERKGGGMRRATKNKDYPREVYTSVAGLNCIIIGTEQQATTTTTTITTRTTAIAAVIPTTTAMPRG